MPLEFPRSLVSALDPPILLAMSPLAHLIALPVQGYRLLLSPWVGVNCRYTPTCSAYALEALEKHGGIKGGWLAICRVARCHPWGGSGVDKVPDRKPSTH